MIVKSNNPTWLTFKPPCGRIPSLTWERFCLFWTVGLLLALILLGLDPKVGFAETEVQGEVSGVWDVEDSWLKMSLA
jgi:hypothetical protein